MTKNGFALLVTLLFSAHGFALLFSATAFASDPLFEEPFAGPLQAELSFPLQDFLRNKREPEPLDGTFRIGDETFDVTVSRRGKSRLEHCSFPPMWLDFDKKALDGTLLDGQNKLKLVTHCSRSLEPRGYLAAEMVIYRMLNLMTDRSFRVRALEIEYVDSMKERSETHHAFVIEHKKRLAKRLGLEPVEAERVALDELESEQVGLLGLVQYMIGNTDFSFLNGPPGDTCCHNAVPMRSADGLVLPLVYDFDSTGFVNPPYATPSAGLGVRSMKQRKYRGFCRHNAPTERAAELLVEKKADVMALIEQFDDVPNLRRKSVLKYIDQFYATIESPKSLASRITRRCRSAN